MLVANARLRVLSRRSVAAFGLVALTMTSSPRAAERTVTPLPSNATRFDATASAGDHIGFRVLRRRQALALVPAPAKVATDAAWKTLQGALQPHPLAALPNYLINDPTGQIPFTGNTQMEPSVAASGDTLVCGFSDSGGLFGNGTLTGYAVSFEGGKSWVDAGSLSGIDSGDPGLVLGDPVVVTDGRGHWYCLSVYDIGNGSGGIGSGDLGVVLHRGSFLGATLEWRTPVLLAGGLPGDALDSPHMAIDPDRDRIYVTYTHEGPYFLTGQIEVVTLSDAGRTILHHVVVQPLVVDVNNAGSRVAVGPNGEVYCAFESGLFTNDGQGPALQKVARSLDQGATFSLPTAAGTVIESWLSGPPGANREEESVEFPSLAVDRSNGPNRGRVYLAWHDGVAMNWGGTWVPVTESPGNDTPQNAQVLPGTTGPWQIDGNLPNGDPVDWYRFSGNAGEHVRLILRPNAWVQFRVHLMSPGTVGVDTDTTLAVSTRQTGDWVFFLFSLPTNGNYYVQIERLRNSGSYTAWLRKATSTSPSTGIDHRDIVVVSSPDGVGSWSPKVRVNDDTGFTDQAFPEVLVDGDGGVHLTWYDRRFDPNTRALADVMLASSFDGGATFTPNLRLTSQSSFWQVPADAVPNFGDRFLPLADGERLFAVWADGRLGEPDVMIAPLELGFDVVAPATLRAIVGQNLGLEVELHNDTPYGDARFQVHVDSDVAAFPDTSIAAGPVVSGGKTIVRYDPPVDDSIHRIVPFTLHLRVTCDRSARESSQDIQVINDQVDVRLADFAARAAADGVHLEWRAAGAAGFDVERAPSVKGPFVRLTASLQEPGPEGRYTYLDAGAPAGERSAYRLMSLETDGRRQTFGPWTVESAAPPRVALLGALPNPFNPSAAIRFELPRAAAVRLRILDVRGRVVATLLEGVRRDAGTHAVLWDGHDASGIPQPSGVYLVELQALGVRQSSRLVLLR